MVRTDLFSVDSEIGFGPLEGHTFGGERVRRGSGSKSDEVPFGRRSSFIFLRGFYIVGKTKSSRWISLFYFGPSPL